VAIFCGHSVYCGTDVRDVLESVDHCRPMSDLSRIGTGATDRPTALACKLAQWYTIRYDNIHFHNNFMRMLVDEVLLILNILLHTVMCVVSWAV